MSVDDKYADDKIEEALNTLFPRREKIPPMDASIVSQTQQNQVEKPTTAIGNDVGSGGMSIFILVKRMSIFNFIMLPTHYYCRIGPYEWHPGNHKDPRILLPPQNMVADGEQTLAIQEFCFYCAEQHLCNLFKRDQTFNFMLNNCQQITGFISETFLIYAYHMLLILFIVTVKFIFFILALIFLTTLILYELYLRNERPSFITCRHIKKI